MTQTAPPPDDTTAGQAEPTPRLAVLRSRDFRWYFIGQTTSGFGNSLSGLALAFAVLSLSRSASVLGIVLLASRLPVIAFALLGGALGDRFSRRLVMLSTDTARTLLQAVSAALLLSGHADIRSLTLLQAAAGAGSAMFAPAANGLVANLAPPGQIRQANSVLGISANVAQISAVGVAGAVIAFIGPGSAFAIDAATFAASTVSLAVIRSESLAAPPTTRRRLLEDIGDGWHAVRGQTWLLVYSVHVSLLNAVSVSPFLVLGPLVAAQHLGGAPAWAGIAMGYAIGALIGNAVVLRWQPRRPLLAALIATLFLAPFLALLAVPGAVWLLILAAVLAGAEASIYNTLTTTTVQSCVPDEFLARASSFITVGGLASVPIGMGLAGTAANTLGTGTVFNVGAIWVVASALGAIAVPSVRRLRAG